MSDNVSRCLSWQYLYPFPIFSTHVVSECVNSLYYEPLSSKSSYLGFASAVCDPAGRRSWRVWEKWKPAHKKKRKMIKSSSGPKKLMIIIINWLNSTIIFHLIQRILLAIGITVYGLSTAANLCVMLRWNLRLWWNPPTHTIIFSVI